MAGPARKRATYEDLLRVPDRYVAEIVGGELHVSPHRDAACTVAASLIAADVGGAFFSKPVDARPDGWLVLGQPELHLGVDHPRDEVLVPDLAGWRRERMPVVPDVAGFTLPPDWVCEVLSPSTHRLDRIAKMDVYARVGVRHAWLVDPQWRTVEVYRLHEGAWLRAHVFEGDTPCRIEPFDAVELDISRWWPEEPVSQE